MIFFMIMSNSSGNHLISPRTLFLHQFEYRCLTILFAAKLFIRMLNTNVLDRLDGVN